MLKRLTFFGFILGLLGVTSCETDFSLNGDYEINPVVFGLLDQSDSIHMIKITKAYLGDGDNLLYAQIPDSNYFEQVDARVIEYDGENPTGREWQLQDSTIGNKSTDGIFYAPEQRIYYFKENELNSEYEYEIVADLNEGAHSIVARTELIHGFSVNSTILSSTFRVRFAKNTVDEDDDYLAWRWDINEGLHARTYEIDYTFRWTEHYMDGTEASFSARKNERSELQDDPDQPSSFTGRIVGLDFFRWIETTIPDDPEVERRTVDGFDLHISVAHRNLTQFMDVAEPVSGIAQVQPEYTNVNGGFGLFSSRVVYTLPDLRFDAATTKELARGQYTITKLFCSDFPEHMEESFYCP